MSPDTCHWHLARVFQLDSEPLVAMRYTVHREPLVLGLSRGVSLVQTSERRVRYSEPRVSSGAQGALRSHFWSESPRDSRISRDFDTHQQIFDPSVSRVSCT